MNCQNTQNRINPCSHRSRSFSSVTREDRYTCQGSGEEPRGQEACLIQIMRTKNNNTDLFSDQQPSFSYKQSTQGTHPAYPLLLIFHFCRSTPTHTCMYISPPIYALHLPKYQNVVINGQTFSESAHRIFPYNLKDSFLTYSLFFHYFPK